MSEKTPREQNKEVNFTSLRQEGSRQSYKGHPAIRSSIPELYYTLLLSILTVDDVTEAQWLHLYRVAAGAKYDTDVYDLLPNACSLTDARLIEAIDSIQRDDLTNAFLLDSMILALLHAEPASTLLAYIADLVTLFSVPQETVNEAIHAAKSIISKDHKKYLSAMTEVEHLNIRESYCYLFKFNETVITDLEKAPSIEKDHLTIACVKAKNLNLDLDSWIPKKITFHDCLFENSSIKSSQKEVHFIGCTFYEKDDISRHTYLSLKKLSTLKECIFKNIVSRAGVLSLANTKIERCTFSNCSIHNDIGDEIFLALSNGTITDSEFIRCCCDEGYTLFDVSKTTVLRCKFSYCETICYTKDYVKSILQATANSAIKDCHFDQCIVTGEFHYIETAYDDDDDDDDIDIDIDSGYYDSITITVNTNTNTNTNTTTTTVTMRKTIRTYIICHSNNSDENNNTFHGCHTGPSLFTVGNSEKLQSISKTSESHHYGETSSIYM